ncbi:hypothetical protein ABZX40_36485 [Streptomyces sp. NPDC004610]|uniref:hypothetical protein n=1 Tax=unclassified Streptomyces TaxID=2593676 RepID=UPI0033A7CDE2
MTGPPAPPPPGGGRPTPAVRLDAGLHGLWVDLGDRRGHTPEARFTCRHGCELEAHGTFHVREFTARIADIHARTCPGPVQ